MRDVADGFTDRVVLVTGAGSGIGRVLALRFADQGAVVVAADVDEAVARATAEEINDAGGRCGHARTDVTDKASVTSTVETTIAAHDRIDVLVNNAAVASDTDFDELAEAEWDRDVAVALRGSFVCAQAVLPWMSRAGRGVVVNMGSVNGFTFVGQDAYSAAKAGLVSLTRGIAVRYGPSGVRCNLVVPGTIRTPAWDERLRRDPGLLDRLVGWYPLGRIGTPDDVAAAVLFLASDDAAWITGSSLVVDGGLLAGNVRFVADVAGPGDASP